MIPVFRRRLTLAATGATRVAMDLDDLFSSKPADPLVLLAKQDLGPMSQDELADRIVALEAEIARTQTHRAAAEQHRSQADDLFKR